MEMLTLYMCTKYAGQESDVNVVADDTYSPLMYHWKQNVAEIYVFLVRSEEE